MKSTIYTFFTLIGIASLSAQTAYQIDFRSLKQNRDRDITYAIKPINEKYVVDLQKILKRATQASDLQTAIEITQELKVLGVKSPPITVDTSPAGHWRWDDNSILVLDENGSASRHSSESLHGKWLWDDIAKRTFHIEWTNKVVVYFTLSQDLSKIKGKNSLGHVVSATRIAAKEINATGDHVPSDLFGVPK